MFITHFYVHVTVAIATIMRVPSQEYWLNTGCPTRYRTRFFFNNFTTNKDIATKQTHTTDTFLFISHTTNLLLFKFRCIIFIGVRIIKEMPSSVASGTPYTTNYQYSCQGKSKGKAVPLQAWSGPECSRKLRFPGFMITAQDGGKVVSLKHRPPLPAGNTPGTHFC